jgi:hypothetical protein
LPVTAREAKKTMEREVEAADRAHVQQLLAAREKYLAELRKAQTQAVNGKRVDDAVAIDKAVQDETREIQKLKQRLKGQDAEHDPAAIEVSGKSYKVADLADGTKAFSNRNYVIVDPPKSLAGWRFTRVDGGHPPEIKVKVKEPGLVYAAACRPTDRLEADGWKRVEDTSWSYNDAKHGTVLVFSKQFDKGEEFVLPQCTGFTGSMLLLPPTAGK